MRDYTNQLVNILADLEFRLAVTWLQLPGTVSCSKFLKEESMTFMHLVCDYWSVCVSAVVVHDVAHLLGLHWSAGSQRQHLLQRSPTWLLQRANVCIWVSVLLRQTLTLKTVVRPDCLSCDDWYDDLHVTSRVLLHAIIAMCLSILFCLSAVLGPVMFCYQNLFDK